MRPADVPIVVGAGASGLATAASLRRRGYRPVVLERDDAIGAAWARRYERLCLHTVRRFSGLPYYSIPREYPRYVPKDLYARYLREYAERLALDVRVGQPVERIRRENGAWALTTPQGEWRSPAVVIATGRHAEKRMPRWPDCERFSGRLVHSGDYRSGHEFAHLRVLVVGMGNSGAEIAADLVEQGARRVAIAVRTPPPITSREIAGVPVQVFGLLLEPLPPRLVDRVGAVVRRLGTGDLHPYGIEPEAWGPFEERRPPLIDVGFLDHLRAGRVDVRRAVLRLTQGGVVFADGLEEPFDAVVAATGFRTGLERLVDASLLDERGLPRAASHAGLFFVGYAESPRGALYEANRDSRRVARAIERYLETAR